MYICLCIYRKCLHVCSCFFTKNKRRKEPLKCRINRAILKTRKTRRMKLMAWIIPALVPDASTIIWIRDDTTYDERKFSNTKRSFTQVDRHLNTHRSIIRKRLGFSINQLPSGVLVAQGKNSVKWWASTRCMFNLE